jgi:phosphoribosylaminoimidazole carboxylase PurE protein
MEEDGSSPLVGILMGSASDGQVMAKAGQALAELGVPCETRVSSAHRTPERTLEYARGARGRGIRVIIAGAGMAAHLAGFVASSTTLPVIGVPLSGTTLEGMDALLATVQMPPGVPVATVAVDGARNAGILAAQMLAIADPALAARLAEAREALRRAVEAADAALSGHDALSGSGPVSGSGPGSGPAAGAGSGPGSGPAAGPGAGARP